MELREMRLVIETTKDSDPDFERFLNKLKEHDNKAGLIIENLETEINSKASPDTLYHYTNYIGLKGIIESGILHLTSFEKLNDPSELEHGISHAIKHFNEIAQLGSKELKLLATKFCELAVVGGVAQAAHFLIASFSEAEDDLGQWRAYADNGRGFAIGFDSIKLIKAFESFKEKDSYVSSTFKVMYDDEKAFNFQKSIIDELVKAMPEKNNFNSSYVEHLLEYIWTRCISSSVLFKHKAYSNEKEYRFLQTHSRTRQIIPDVKYRSRSYELVRYREFNWRSCDNNIIKTISVGPAADEAKARKFIADCLAAYHSGDQPEVKVSDIPYRS